MKTCSYCRKTKETTEFPRSRREVDGLHGWCKTCVKLHTNTNRGLATPEERRQAERLKKASQGAGRTPDGTRMQAVWENQGDHRVPDAWG